MLKLGIIQLSIQEGNIEKNCAHIEELVRKHSSDDIDLLCFPELCISGYNFEKAIISDREALFFSELASKYKIAIMAGINKKEGNQHYDVACIWDETGTLLGEYKKIEKDRIGEVKIADEVVAIIAGLAATEVDGVDSMAGNITNELVGKLGMKNLSKGVKVTVTEDHVIVDLSLNMKYGYSIPAVSEKVQDKVKTAIENMTGLMVLEVNIKIAGVNMPAEA